MFSCCRRKNIINVTDNRVSMEEQLLYLLRRVLVCPKPTGHKYNMGNLDCNRNDLPVLNIVGFTLNFNVEIYISTQTGITVAERFITINLICLLAMCLR